MDMTPRPMSGAESFKNAMGLSFEYTFFNSFSSRIRWAVESITLLSTLRRLARLVLGTSQLSQAIFPLLLTWNPFSRRYNATLFWAGYSLNTASILFHILKIL